MSGITSSSELPDFTIYTINKESLSHETTKAGYVIGTTKMHNSSQYSFFVVLKVKVHSLL